MAESTASSVPTNVKDIRGFRFHRLVVIEFAGTVQGCAVWRCQCDCGKIKEARANALKLGNVRSCGCLQREYIKTLTTHGMTNTPEYYCWRGLRVRGTKLNGKDSRNYVARGITVCERWLHSFENFFADMGPRPSSDHTVERLDNDGSYTPENCAWRTTKEQGQNRRTTRILFHKGQKLSGTAWAEKMGLDRGLVNSRIRKGWEVTAAIETPSRHKKPHTPFGV